MQPYSSNESSPKNKKQVKGTKRTVQLHNTANIHVIKLQTAVSYSQSNEQMLT